MNRLFIKAAITSMVIFSIFSFPRRGVTQDFMPEPQVFPAMKNGWLYLVDNPELMSGGAGSYGGYVTTNLPSMSVRTNTGIMGYDGGYELTYRHNLQNAVSYGALTGFDINTPLGKIGLGLFPVGLRKLNLNLYEFPLGYYDTIPAESMPHFDWNFSSGGYGIGIGWSRKWNWFSLGFSVIYSQIRLKMGHIVMLPFNEINDSIGDMPIQFAYIPDYREFAGEGKNLSFTVGGAVELGSIVVAFSASKTNELMIDGSASSRIYLPLDTLLAREVDSTFFSGNVISILGISGALIFPGYQRYAFSVQFPAGERGKVELSVNRLVWDRPTTICETRVGFWPAVLIDNLFDTLRFNLRDVWGGRIGFEYRTIHRSIISLGVGYRTPLIDSEPYMPLFFGGGALLSADFEFSYFISDDISLDVRYVFSKNSAFIANPVELRGDNLPGEYVSSNDALTVGFTYVFPEN